MSAGKIKVIDNTDEKNYLFKSKDGGLCIDNETGSYLYIGKEALRLVDRLTYVHKETQIINGDSGKLRITVNDKSCVLEGRGAIAIGKNTNVKIDVLDGEPIVVTTERTPKWYNKFTNNKKNKNTFSNMFSDMNRNNLHLRKGEFKKELLRSDIIDRLIKMDIIKDADDGCCSFKEENLNSLENKLNDSNIDREDISNVTELFQKVKSRKNYGKMHGEFIEGDLKRQIIAKLYKSGL